jgi:hypothetical protein
MFCIIEFDVNGCVVFVNGFVVFANVNVVNVIDDDVKISPVVVELVLKLQSLVKFFNF